MKYTVGCWFIVFLLLCGCDSKSQLDVSDIKKELESKAEKAAHYEISITGDIAAGKLLAKKCAECHGIDGVAARTGAPFIAGLPQDYLTRSMLAYINGSRKNDDMKEISTALEPVEIANVSAYYATLNTPWDGSSVGVETKPSIITEEAIAAGEVIAQRCNSCHGENGSSEKDSIIPSLSGMQPGYFIPALTYYFEGQRQHNIMKVFKVSLDREKIEQLATYYATRTPKKAPQPTKGNTALGKKAAAACAGCHGYSGNSNNPHIPNLAGLSATYIAKALKDYRDGKRPDKIMRSAVRGLNNTSIINLAAYYALQTPESLYQRAQGQSEKFDPVAEGEKIASSCAACHGETGNSTRSGYPSLTGLNVRYLVAATRAYQESSRKNNEMTTMVSHLSDTDIEKLSYYYASQKPVPVKKSITGDAAAGEKIAVNCEACHGKHGNSQDPKNPSLAGQDAKYLVSAIKEYANGKRPHKTMKGAVEDLSNAGIKNVAAYYATQTPVQPEFFLPLEPSIVIEQRCSRCHGERGFSTEAGKPRLAGQVESYLIVAIKEYQDGTRKSKMMHAVSYVLSMIEIEAIAAYYARQKKEE